MLRRLFGLALIIIITGGIASFLNSQDGYTVIEWMGWRLEARTSVLVAVAAGFILLIVAFDRLVGAIIGLPDRISSRLSRRRQEQGHHALALGLVAASAGDARESARQAKKATHLMGENTLTDLLSAQAAGLNGDYAAATSFFEKLSQHRETAFFGKAGLMRLQAEDGRAEAALTTGREALQLNPNAPTLGKAVLALEVRHQHWEEALTALNIAARGEDMKPENTRHIEAVLQFKKAEAAIENNTSDDMIIKMLEASLKADPGFVPAALAIRAYYAEAGRGRKIGTMLTRAFAANPHPEIAQALYETWSGHNDYDTDAFAKLIKLIDKGGNDQGAVLAAARIAMRLSLWGEALRLITMIPEEDRPNNAWQMMADLAEHAPETPGQKWPEKAASLVKASTAKPGQRWVCQNCHSAHQDWHDTCPSCDGFASLQWQ